MYKFEVNIDSQAYDTFINNHSLISIMQQRAWAHVKNNWENVLVGLYKDDILVATASLLIRKMALNINLIYIPRGYVIDYTDEKLVQAFTNEIKKYAKTRKAYCVKIDPFFCINETSLKEETEIPLNFNLDADKKHKILLNSGYLHKGYKKTMSSYLQPRYNMAVSLIDKNNNFLDPDTLKNSISKTTRNYIGNYHQKRGVYFSYTSNVDDIDIFYDIINMTEKRQNITLRNKDYFKRIIESYGGKAILCFAHVDLIKYKAFLEEELKGSKNNIDDIKRQYEQALGVIASNGNGIITSVALVVLPSNEKGIRMMEYLYAGNNTNLLPHLNTNVGLLFDIFKMAIDKQIHYCNLGGVEGTFDDKLFAFKSKFNPVILEFVGEYDLPIDKKIYRLINVFLPIAKNTYKKARNIIKKVKR